MKRKLYQVVASKIVAIKNCERDGNAEWLDKHDEDLKCIVIEHFPHGSGIDGSHGEFDLDKCDDRNLVFRSSYHRMDENGMYDGWVEFTVVVKPSLCFGITVDIKGIRNDELLVEYLKEMYDSTLNETIEGK